MKNCKLIFLSILIIISSVFFSCNNNNNNNDDDDNNNQNNIILKVNVKKEDANTPFVNGATIKIFTSLKDLNEDNYLEKKVSSLDTSASCTFENLSSAKYYLKGKGVIGADVYEKVDSVEMGSDLSKEFNLVLKSTLANGTLEVFVTYNTGTVAYCASAEVGLYESKEAFNNGDNPLFTGYTDANNPTPSGGYGAYFQNVPFAKYYIYSKWRKSSADPWMEGSIESYVPKGVKTTLFITVKYFFIAVLKKLYTFESVIVLRIVGNNRECRENRQQYPLL